MMFDFSVPMFNDPNVRKAVALTIDGEGISKNVAGAFYKGGCGISGKGVPGYDPKLCQYFPYDPEQAKALLKESGWADSDGDGVLDKDGQPMKFELEIWNMAPMPRYGEAIAIQLKEAGFPVELQTVEFGTWIDDLFKGPGKAMMASGFCTDGGLNGVFGREAATAKALKYDMPEIYDLLDKANLTIDPAKRDEILREAQEKLFSQYLSVPLQHSSGYAAAQTWVHDFPGAMWTLNVVTDRNNAWVAK
jgi:peptide/nickel transport system substrate-binding protein